MANIKELARTGVMIGGLLAGTAGVTYGVSQYENRGYVNSSYSQLKDPTTPTIGTPTVGEASGTPTPQGEIKGFAPAQEKGNEWTLKNPDGGEADMTLPAGFTPDARLVVPSDLTVNPINSDLSVYADWEKALNTGRPVGDRLAGYNYDYNDFCPTADDMCNVQGDMYAWRVFQGQEVEVPGIGRLVGGPRISVVLLFINLDDSVVAWDNQVGGQGQVKVERGFTATGRIFDGNKLTETEENLAGHWLFTQENGDPGKSYIGITDSPDNAQGTLFVTVVRKQWGNNPDGSKRMENQLMRAELVNFGKGK